MNTYDRIKNLAKEHGLSIRQLGFKIGIGESTIYKWREQIPKTDVISKVADELNTSVDYLLGRTDDPYSLSKKEEDDVGVKVEELLNGIQTEDSVNFFGEPMTDEDKLAIKSALKIAVEMNKRRAKKSKTKK